MTRDGAFKNDFSQNIDTCSPASRREDLFPKDKDKDCNLGFRVQKNAYPFQIQFERKLLKIFGPDMAHFLKNIWRIIVGRGFIQNW